MASPDAAPLPALHKSALCCNPGAFPCPAPAPGKQRQALLPPAKKDFPADSPPLPDSPAQIPEPPGPRRKAGSTRGSVGLYTDSRIIRSRHPEHAGFCPHGTVAVPEPMKRIPERGAVRNTPAHSGSAEAGYPAPCRKDGLRRRREGSRRGGTPAIQSMFRSTRAEPEPRTRRKGRKGRRGTAGGESRWGHPGKRGRGGCGSHRRPAGKPSNMKRYEATTDCRIRSPAGRPLRTRKKAAAGAADTPGWHGQEECGGTGKTARTEPDHPEPPVAAGD